MHESRSSKKSCHYKLNEHVAIAKGITLNNSLSSGSINKHKIYSTTYILISQTGSQSIGIIHSLKFIIPKQEAILSAALREL